MLKNILNLEGALLLSKNEQKSINGGKPYIPECGGVGFVSPEKYCLSLSGYIWHIETACCYNHNL